MVRVGVRIVWLVNDYVLALILLSVVIVTLPVISRTVASEWEWMRMIGSYLPWRISWLSLIRQSDLPVSSSVAQAGRCWNAICTGQGRCTGNLHKCVAHASIELLSVWRHTHTVTHTVESSCPILKIWWRPDPASLCRWRCCRVAVKCCSGGICEIIMITVIIIIMAKTVTLYMSWQWCHSVYE